MSSLLRQLTDKYWFRTLLSLSLGITTTLLAVNGTFIWMGICLCALLWSLWWQLRLYRHHTRQVLFMIDALENNDNSFHFPEEESTSDNREINRALNRVGRILYNVKADTAQQEKYYELILNCISTGLLVLNDNGAVYQKNEEALRLLGLSVFTHVQQLSPVSYTHLTLPTKA